jgi:hypothetical protein
MAIFLSIRANFGATKYAAYVTTNVPAFKSAITTTISASAKTTI